MAAYVWKTGTSGDWSGSNWTTSGFPNSSTATVTISAAGTYTVTIAGGDSWTANTVTLNSSGAVLEVDGTLTLAGTAPALTVTAGEFDLVGELIGGTVKATGGTLVIENGATLDGVTWQAPLTFAANQELFVAGGLTVKTAAGGTPGSIDMTAGNDTLYVEDSETLNNATLNFGSGGGNYLYNYDSSGTGDTLTLGSGFTVEQSGGTNYLYNNYNTDAIVNAGKINVSGGDLVAYSGTFTNSGSIAISGGGEVDLSATTATNSGHISIATSSELVLGSGFSNTGSIAIASGGTLDLAGAVTLSELTGITNSGGTLQVDTNGTLDLGGGTLTVATTGLFSDVVDYGTLSDGTVKPSGGSITLENNATLDGVTWLGTLTFAASQNLHVTGGLTVKTAAGATPGSIDMTAGSDSLYVEDSETLNNATLNFGSTGGNYLINFDPQDAGLTLTLGSGFTVEQSGGDDYLSNYFGYDADTIVNAGKINVTGGDLIVQSGTFTNSGSIAVSGSGTEFQVSDATFTNGGKITITGGGTVDLSSSTLTNNGTITVGSGSDLILGSDPGTGTITVASGGTVELAGSITLAGLESLGLSIAAGGTLQVDTSGTLDLGGGTMDVATGLFANVVDYGTLSDGTVKLAGGSITLENYATLDGITWLGALTFAASQRIYVLDGLTVKTTAGGTPGSIDMTAGGDALYVLDNETLNNATLNFGSTGGNYLTNFDPQDAGLTLTLGSGFTIEQSGGDDYLSNYFGYDADTIVNAGKINVTGGDLVVQNGTFTNSGKITITGGGTVDLSSSTLTSNGTITVGSGSDLILGSDPGTGTITVASGGTVELAGSITLAGLESLGLSIAAGGTLQVDANATLDLGGGTLVVATTGLFANVVDYGTLSDGTVKPSGGSITLESNATLDGITWLGTLTFAASQSLYVLDGLTVKTAAGGTPGSIDMTAGNDRLFVLDSETLNNATLNFGSTGGNSLYNDALYDADLTLTLGSGFTIEQSGGDDYLSVYIGYDYPGTIVNAGKIDVSGGDLFVQYGTFTNSGSIAVSGSGTEILVEDATFTNSGSITISGGGTVDLSSTALTNNGTITVGSGSDLILGSDPGTGTITVASGGTVELAGSITLAGLESLGLSIAAGGTLQVDSNGTLDLGGGTMDVATGLFANVVEYGTLSDGTVKPSGGSITLESNATLDGITWLGTLTFAASQSLYVLDGLTVKTAAGGTPGSIDMTAGGDSLYVLDSETLNNATLNFGSTGGNSLYNDALYDADLTLTLGSGFIIEQSGGDDYLSVYIGYDYPGTIVNAGKINVSGGDLFVQYGTFTNSGSIAVSGSGSEFQVDDTTFTNSGSITISGGGTVDLSATALTNNGTITVGSGSNLILGSDPGTGTITVASGGTVELTGTVTLAGLESLGLSIAAGGTLMVDNNSTLDLGGGTMDVATGLFANVVDYGTLSDGTVKLAGGSITLENSATLDAVTWLGTLTFAYDQSLNVIGGLIVKTAAGGTPGSIDMTAGQDTLFVDDSETLNNATLNFGSSGGNYLYNANPDGTGQTLTLGSGFTIEQSAGNNYLFNSDGYGYSDAIANAGKINVSGGDLLVEGGTFTSSGSITITGGEVDLSDATATNSGHISIGTDSELVLGAAFSNTGSLTIASGGTVELTGTVTLAGLETGTITNSGGTLQVDSNATLNLGGGTMDVATTGLFNNVVVDGTLSDGTVKLDGGSIALNNATLDGITWRGTLTFAASQSLNVIGGLTVETAAGGTPGTIDMTAGNDTLYVEDSETLNNATLNFGSTGGNTLYSDVYSLSITLTLGSGFTIEQSGGTDSLTNPYGVGTIVNAGKIDVTGGDLIVNYGTFTNSGSVSVSDSGYVFIGSGTFRSTGSISIGSGGTLEINPSTAANITYNDPANLILDNPSHYTGTLSGLMTGDTLQLDGENITSAGIAGTTLTVHLNGGGTLTYKTGPGLNGTTFSVSEGTDGYARDLLTVLCFLGGTLIATPSGETAVEHLAVGDMVRTASGAVRPIAWIGQGRVLATRGRRNAATPVIVSKGALGPNIPHRDLRVTKGHSFHLDDVLIPVEFLVNHRSIHWDDRAQEVVLYHIELETHDVLLANGAPAESYRDDGNRWLFQNANSGWHLPPKPPCAPVLTGGPVVDAVWRRLSDRAGPRPSLPMTNDPDLHLLVDGRRVDADLAVGSSHIFRLPARPESVRIVSRAGVPQELGTARDPRPLGVAVRQIVVTRGKHIRTIEAAGAPLTQGFHGYEPDDAIRWTDGDAVVPPSLFDGCDEPLELALCLGGTTTYAAEGALLRVA